MSASPSGPIQIPILCNFPKEEFAKENNFVPLTRLPSTGRPKLRWHLPHNK